MDVYAVPQRNPGGSVSFGVPRYQSRQNNCEKANKYINVLGSR